MICLCGCEHTFESSLGECLLSHLRRDWSMAAKQSHICRENGSSSRFVAMCWCGEIFYHPTRRPGVFAQHVQLAWDLHVAAYLAVQLAQV